MATPHAALATARELRAVGTLISILGVSGGIVLIGTGLWAGMDPMTTSTDALNWIIIGAAALLSGLWAGGLLRGLAVLIELQTPPTT